ncbi:pseudaminic acid cytidylyltransferase [Paraglaciecola hydrolytica]|uniref:Pseudaminic acid cytidylyltransferase n=1 Tax=Paraglaciecola hydrolytica TaxID=1799789 RepID=A0A148KNL3_9ALTE|nr:pseudaminic acid cytidylyltransferase [Paraglaciecola hydrolytica]KXI27904.1 pseudaminic acid cytidylyltransferase [Paraglaciecola hydrolytica]
MKLAVIPARGGSKRIPHKNIKEFAGKPLIAYSIQAAQQSGLFDKIWVSTDDEQIAEVALSYGAEVPFIRPPELADDFTGTTPVIRHAIEYCREHFTLPEYTCCIYATAPFLQAKYLQQGFTQLNEDNNKAFAFSCTTFAFPVQRALIKQGSGVAPLYPEYIAKRSQDLPEALHDAGQFYWGRSVGFMSNKKMFSEDAIPIVLPRYLVQDIDSAEDWQRAELMYQAYMSTKNNKVSSNNE